MVLILLTMSDFSAVLQPLWSYHLYHYHPLCHPPPPPPLFSPFSSCFLLLLLILLLLWFKRFKPWYLQKEQKCTLYYKYRLRTDLWTNGLTNRWAEDYPKQQGQHILWKYFIHLGSNWSFFFGLKIPRVLWFDIHLYEKIFRKIDQTQGPRTEMQGLNRV